ncbi:exportin-6-like [Liolophura sinensis]|uniref:exportin-6-like n=1 Tax=Liolophura sinensis TaxID=3198878 RepID=UPI003158B168
MASDEGSLRSLEALMSEFFDGRTTNQRKREIEDVLNNFSQTQDAWKHSLYYLAHTENQYVLMYCMTVVENLINKRWVGFDGQDKLEIRTTLNQFLLSQHKRVPSYIRNKLVKLVVDIGRIDWPHFYPSFFMNILQLVQQPDSVELGVVLLQTTSEELAAPREDLSVDRKEELRRLLLAQIPTVLDILNSILESVLEKHRHLVAATPPPSPTHGSDRSTPRQNSMPLFANSSLASGDLLSNMFTSPGRGIQYEALPPLDTESHKLCVLTLNCLSHYFSWIPLSTTITPALLSTIFHFAAFGCEVSHASRQSSPNSSFSMETQGLGVLAMNCVNELLAKNCVPQEFEDFLLQMFQQTFCLLQRLTKESNTNASGNRLAELDETYIEKFTEFLRLFVSVHLKRCESNDHFPVLELLALMFKYTLKQPTLDGFYNCLDIWSTFLDYLHTKMNGRSMDSEQVLSKYKEALHTLVSHILQKMQFRYNQTFLEELDDDTLDDDGQTEWQQYLRHCLEVVAKAAELNISDIFGILYTPFQEYLEIYMGLEQFVASTPQGRQLSITGENECRRLHCTLRDLSSLLQALGRLSDHFVGGSFVERFSDAQILLNRLVHTVVYCSKVKLYEVTSVAQSVLGADFIEVHAQALAAIKAYATWLSQYYLQSHREKEQLEKCEVIITTLVEATTPLISKQVPEKIVHSACHLLVSLMTTVRPSHLLQLPSIQGLYNLASQGQFSQLSTEAQLLLYRSLSHYLLLPWPSLTEGEQNWTHRADHHHQFIHQLTTQYKQLTDTPTLSQDTQLQGQAKPLIKKSLQVMKDLVESIAGETVKSKQICFQSMQDLVSGTLVLFPIYIHQPDVTDDILGFFLALFQGLRVQMGIPFTEKTIQTFLSLFSSDQLTETILHESSAGTQVVEKFLKILEVIVLEPGHAFKAFLPSIISICMEQIYPIIAERPSPDIKATLYMLLYQILTNNWRYFFKGTVLSLLQTKVEKVEHQPQFEAIMQSFGQSFLQPDIAIFKQNLESLENLNEKWKLYQKKLFREQMLSQFLSVLIQVLIHKSHDLLQEEITMTVYNMAAVDFTGFYDSFLTQFLSICDNLDSNQRTVLSQNFKIVQDLPSFSQNLTRFVNDLRYYRLLNTSLPAGSVTF